MTTTLTSPPTTRALPTWEDFIAWARIENEYQKKIAGVHAPDHPNPILRGRTYFEVNLYRYYHCLSVCWPYLTSGKHKMLDVGSWPGVWMRVVAHFCQAESHEIWATGLMFPDQFLEKMAGACAGIMKCELDSHSPMADPTAPTALTESNFTFITAMEVVEHLYQPADMFNLLAASMSPSATLVLTTNNAARFQNILGLLRGDGLVGNLDELLPRNGGQLGAWRPHMREYLWQDLADIANQSDFSHLAHGFYQENYALRLLENQDPIIEGLYWSNPSERPLLDELNHRLADPNQLKSGMYLVLKK